MASQSGVIETIVGKVAAELAKRGIGLDDRITITRRARGADRRLACSARTGDRSWTNR
jgi:hypothetical protein